MATDFDRDDRLHGVLRDTLRSQSASGPCIDTATLAAWAEGALTPEETAAADAHLATCARCRELAATLSTMTETESAPAAAVVPFTPRPNGRWKVMIGAAGAVAASVLIWVAVRDGSPSLDTTSAANRAGESQAREMGGKVPPAAPATQAFTAESSAASRRAEGASAAQPRADAPGGADARQAQQGARALSTPRPEAKLAQENAARLAEASQISAKPSPVPEPLARLATPPPPLPAAVPAPPPPRPVPTAPPPSATAGAARSSTATGLPQSTINIDISGIKQSDPMRSSETFFAMTIIAEFVVGADLQAAEGQQGQGFGAVADRRAAGAGRGGGGGGGRGGGAAAAGGVARQNADGFFSAVPVRWRLSGGAPVPSMAIAALQRSKNEGVTWESVALPAQTTMLSGGSAPTNTVCWLVGRAGTVLLSTDGTTFRQVTKPVEADLVSVRATDARSATVRTADGRTFATSDGGATWTSRSEDLLSLSAPAACSCRRVLPEELLEERLHPIERVHPAAVQQCFVDVVREHDELVIHVARPQ